MQQSCKEAKKHMHKNLIVEKVKMALLGMQRYSWEHGVGAQAFLELGEEELVVVMAKAAVLNQLADGRPGAIGNISAVTDPAAIGEALLYSAKLTGDPDLENALDKTVNWLLNNAPRSREGILYHVVEKPQMWVDSFYMAPPFLSAAGYHEEAVKQIKGYVKLLYHADKRLFSHIWDESKGAFGRKDFWGVGNGWALAGMTRVIRTLPAHMEEERKLLIHYVKVVADACLSYMREDGLFHDVIDDPASFVETNLSQMLAYTLYRGMAAGWLEASYLPRAEKLRKAAYEKVDRYGYVQGVCGAPNFDRPGIAAEGQAFFLLMEAAAEDYYNREA